MSDTSGNLDRETRILIAAGELIARYGYDKTTIDDIARAAGISKGAVYLHFRGKDELVETLILREAELMLDDLMARLDADPQGVTIFNVYRYAVVTLLSRPLLRAMYANERHLYGDFTRRLRRLPIYNQASAFSVDFVRQFQDAGLIRKELPADTVAYLLLTLRVGLLFADDFFLPDQAPTLDRVGDTMSEMLTRALSPENIDEADREKGRAALVSLLEMGRELVRQQRADRQQRTKGESS